MKKLAGWLLIGWPFALIIAGTFAKFGWLAFIMLGVIGAIIGSIYVGLHLTYKD